MALKDFFTKRRTILLIIIVLFLIIIAVLIYLWQAYYKAPSNVILNQNLNQAGLPSVNAPLPFNTPNAGVLADVRSAETGVIITPAEQSAALFTAQSFAERFGTYSNQNGYKNFADLDIFMTTAFKKWVESYKTTLAKQNPDINTYYALVTKAISSDIQSYDAKTGKTEVLVKTLRQEFNKSTTNPKIYYQNLLLKLIKQDSQWMVDGAYWQ